MERRVERIVLIRDLGIARSAPARFDGDQRFGDQSGKEDQHCREDFPAQQVRGKRDQDAVGDEGAEDSVLHGCRFTGIVP